MTGTAFVTLTLSHFRSHVRGVIDTGGGSIALHGPNGAGKTNVLEAVSMLSPGRGFRRAAADDMARRPERLGWKVTALLADRGREHEIETWSEAGAARTVRIDGKAASQAALGRLVRVLWLVPVMDRLWTEGADGRRRFLDRIAMSFEPAHGDAVLTYEKAMRERNRLLKEQVQDPAWYRALESQMGSAGARMHTNRSLALALLGAAQDGAETAFPTADLGLTHPDGAVDAPEDAEALTMAISRGRSRDLAAGRALIGPHRADLEATYRSKGVAARDCSTGEQKALLISLVLANARALARKMATPPVLLLDEVAAHLDAGRREALYAEVGSLGCQAWMTGTGPELFEGLDGACRIAVSERDGVSQLEPV
ncbi:MAG: DNA replication/repair protein RecF [Pseudomonadota bacterium]